VSDFLKDFDWQDIVLHLLAAVCVVSLARLGVWPFAVANALFWHGRELWQHDWEPRNMGSQSQVEWIVPAAAGFIVAGFEL